MAADARDKLRTSDKVGKLAKSTGKTFTHIADQWVEKLGTSRMSEVVAKIGNTKEPRAKIISDYLRGL